MCAPAYVKLYEYIYVYIYISPSNLRQFVIDCWFIFRPFCFHAIDCFVHFFFHLFFPIFVYEIFRNADETISQLSSKVCFQNRKKWYHDTGTIVKSDPKWYWSEIVVADATYPTSHSSLEDMLTSTNPNMCSLLIDQQYHVLLKFFVFDPSIHHGASLFSSSVALIS